jgi:hypothetical protein
VDPDHDRQSGTGARGRGPDVESKAILGPDPDRPEGCVLRRRDRLDTGWAEG